MTSMRNTTIIILFFSLSGFTSEKITIQKEPFPFVHHSFKERNLTELNRRMDLDRRLAAYGDDTEEIFALKSIIFNTLEYGHNFRDQNLRKGNEILKGDKRGKAYLCTVYSSLFVQAALSRGLTARYYYLRKPTGHQHAACEVWSNDAAKWIFIDPTRNLHCEEGGLPLSLMEIRRAWLRDRGRSLTLVFGKGEERREYSFRDFPVQRDENLLWKERPLEESWFSYAWQVALVGRNDFASEDDHLERKIWSSIRALKCDSAARDTSWPFHRYPAISAMEQLESPLNTVQILPGPDREDTCTKVEAKSYVCSENRIPITIGPPPFPGYVPFPEVYQLRVNRGHWQDVSSAMEIPLTTAWTRVEGRVVNQAGRSGPVSVIQVRKR